MILSFFFTASEDGVNNALLDGIKKRLLILKDCVIAYKNSLNGATPTVRGFVASLQQSKISAEAAGVSTDKFSAKLLLLRARALLLNAALGLGIGFLVSYGVKAFTEWRQRVDNAAASAKEAADAATDTTASVKELVDAYKELGDKSGWDTDDFDQAKDIQDQLLDLAKEQSSLDQDRVEALNLQNGKYEDQLDLLDKLTMKQLEAASYDLTTSKDAQGEKLVQTGKIQKRSHLLTVLNSDEMSMADNIRDSGIDIENSLGGFGADNWKDPDSIVAYYDNIGDALKYVIDNTTEAERKAGGAYHNLYQFLIDEQNALKDDVENYNDSTDAIKDNANARAKLAAVILMEGQKDNTTGGYSDYEKINSALETLKSTIDGFDSTKLNDLLWGNNEGLTNEQIDALTVLRKAITDMDFSADTDGANAFIQALVQLGMVSLNATDGLTGLQQAAQDMEEISKEIDNLQSAYKACSTAMEEYNKYGYMSADSLQSLLSMDTQYLSCLDLVDGKLQINKQRYAELLAAQYAQAEVTAIQQATEELKAIQDEATKEKVEGLTTATEEQQTAMENAIPAIKDTTVATGDLAVALAAAQGAAGDDEALNERINAVTTALNTKLAAIHANTQAAINSGTALANQLNGFPNAKKKNKENAKSVTDVASAFDTLTKAMKEYNQYGYICADTMKSLIGVDDKFTACLTEQNGKLKINTATFRTFIKAQLEEANASKDGGKSAAEMQRILDWLNSSVDSDTISFEQLTDAIKGYGSAMDEALEKTNTIKSAFSGLSEVGKNKIDNPFGLLDADSVEKQYQAIRDLADGSELFTNADYAGALNPETGEIDYNSDAFKKMFLDRLDSMITACKETGGAAGEYLAKGFEDARDKISGNVISIEEYINGIGSTLSNINDRMDNFQSAFNDLADITKEYNTYGNLSQDSIQKFMALDPKYTACLKVQGDKLVFNKDAFRALYVAELKELALKYEGTDAGKVFADVLQKVSDGTWDVTDHMQGMGTEMGNLKSALNELKDLFSSLLGLFEKFGSNKDNDLKLWGEAMTEEIDKRIDALNKQKEALEKANDEEERAITLAKLQAELEKARTQRTVRKYTSNGYEWVADASAVKEAQDNLNDQRRTWRKEDVEKAIDDQIDKLNELKDKYSEIINLIGTSLDDYNKKLKYSAEIADMTFTEMEGRLDVFKGNVLGAMQSTKAVSGIQDVISKLESLITTLEKVNNLYSWAESGFTDYTDKGFNGLIKTAKKIFGSTGPDGKLNISISTGLKNIGKTVKNAFSGTSGNSITKAFQAGWEAISSGAKGLFSGSGANSLTTIFSNGLSGIGDLIGSAFKGLGSTFASGGQILVKAAGNVATKIGSALGIGGGVAVGGATAAGGGVAIAGASAIPVIGAIVAGVVNGINTNIRLIKNQKEIWSGNDKIGTKIVKSVGNIVWRYSPIGMIASTIQNISGFVKKIFGIESKKDKNNGTSSNGKIDVGSIVINSPDSPASNANSGTSGSDTGTTKQSFWDRIKNSKLWFWNWGKRAVGDKGVKHSGMYNVDEQGPELLVRQPASGRYTYLETGDGVVPADITSKLFEMGGNTDKWFADQLSKNGALNNIQNKTIGDTISVGDIYIQNPVGDTDALAREIVRDLPIKLRQQQGRR